MNNLLSINVRVLPGLELESRTLGFKCIPLKLPHKTPTRHPLLLFHLPSLSSLPPSLFPKTSFDGEANAFCARKRVRNERRRVGF